MEAVGEFVLEGEVFSGQMEIVHIAALEGIPSVLRLACPAKDFALRKNFPRKNPLVVRAAV